jgi:hypothetical protein
MVALTLISSPLRLVHSKSQKRLLKESDNAVVKGALPSDM